MADMTEGASIAVNGVCLTAVDPRPDSFSADLAPETLRRSNLGDLRAGSRVNLERPLSPAGRLSGHIVQGHVDGTGEFLSLEALGDENWWLRIRVPAELDPFLVYKGSIAIDGISLTIAALEGDVLCGDHHSAHLPQHHAGRLSPRRARQPGVRRPGQARGKAAAQAGCEAAADGREAARKRLLTPTHQLYCPGGFGWAGGLGASPAGRVPEPGNPSPLTGYLVLTVF